MPDPRDGVRVPSDPALVDIIAEAVFHSTASVVDLFDLTPEDVGDLAGLVAAAITAPENREAVLRELRAAWGDDLGGALVKSGWRHKTGGWLYADPRPPFYYEPVYRWAEPPRQPAPSTESEK